ncbi:MAG: class I SAM-dependent methyltransferase [Firmicutes bacterium]|nr:class I SAM-dependent methyltransferase [Bacillota bacterium]
MERISLLNKFYDGDTEDQRLIRSRHGQLEFFTTMHYIHQMVPENGRILEIGAGTGRYSIALAKEGFPVTGVELADKNYEKLVEYGKAVKTFTPYQGDALDLSVFPDNSFDLTLILGPLYHLYDRNDQIRAIREAIRVTKLSGIIMAAFLSVHAIIYDNYLQGNTLFGLDENFTSDYQVRHFTDQLFTGFNIDEFESLFTAEPVEWITTAATDGLLELAEDRKDFAMSDQDFAAFADYHLHHCERRDLLGCSSHLLYICRKK